ncbi:MAG: flavin reductase family protein [Saprospiraceae bacterium]|nr:flavin reductase family protein [Saprospiraceae bacterium]MDW8229990.1 flavin reductase family protein [Saprospiraceae bacterium]
MRTIDPTQIATKDLHQFILGAVGPRPIAFASTISADGVPNLAPYSFFNAFSSNPPILIFSSNRRVENNTTKDTLQNVKETGEVVIHAVSYAMARQMALCSIEYDASINEFEKAGFTPLPSERVRPFRVAESPVHMECVVDNILPLGEKGGAGNLIVCRMVLMHISEDVLTPSGRIDPHKIDLIGRLGRFYYARASGDAIFEVVQKVNELGVGFDALPYAARHSPVLTGNELARIAALTQLPSREEALADPAVVEAIQQCNNTAELHLLVRQALERGDVEQAAKLVVAGD